MGLFSSIGKIFKGVSKVAGFIPGIGGTISKITGSVGGLLDRSGSNAKMRTIGVLGSMRSRGMAPLNARLGMLSAARLTRASPVLPGGAIATPRGNLTQSGAAPPLTYGGTGRAAANRVFAREALSQGLAPRRRRRKAKATKKRAAVRRTVRRKSRLKFGSPAWRKKYLKRR